MRLVTALLTLTSLVPALAHPTIDPSSPTCFGACKLALSYVSFTTPKNTASAAFIDFVCLNEYARRSAIQCTHEYCTDKVRDEGIVAMNRSCVRSGMGGFAPVEVVRGEVRKVGFEEGGLWGEVVVPDYDFFERGYWTDYAVSYIHARHVGYAGTMFIYWTVVILIGLFYRIFGERLHQTTGRKPVDDSVGAAGGLSIWLRRFIVLPATFGYKKAQPFGWYTVPPRVQSLTIFVFVVINIWYASTGYFFSDKNIYFPTFQKQVWRFLSDRTGIISYANFPLIWVFGLRNNLLLYATGWDFGTYNNFHRWVARVATAHAIVHSVGYTVLVFIDGGWVYFWFFFYQFFWWMGTIATVGMVALLGFSFYWVRRNYYETFLALHIGLSVVVLYCIWGHLTIFGGQFDFIIWMCTTVWIGDRIGRFLRIVAFNPFFWQTKARVEYDDAANIIRVTVPCDKSLYRPQEGTFYYLYLLNDWKFWESHPFTVATLPPPSNKVDTGDTAPLLHSSITDADLDSDADLVKSSTLKITFLIRPYDGFTSRLKNKVLAAPYDLRLIVEGPYGHTALLDAFGTSLFIVGGSGIVIPLSHLRRLREASRAIRIVWAVREVAFANSVLIRDFAGLDVVEFADREGLSLDIYVTAGNLEGLKVPEGVRVFDGRPEVAVEVMKAVRGARERCAVVACGPGVMADEARKTVVEEVARGYEVDYFEEAFNW